MKLIWDITRNCNLNCKHCGAANLQSQKPLDKKNAIKLIENIKKFTDSVDILGGEPFCYPYIWDVFDKLIQEKIEISIITNGQFPKEVIDKITEYPLKNILVSVEGLEKENDFVRGNGTWKKTLFFLMELLKAKRENHLLTNIGVNITINKLNLKKLEELLIFYDGIGIDYIQFNPIILEGNAISYVEDLMITAEEEIDAYEKIMCIASKLNRTKISINIAYPIISKYLNLKYNVKLPIINAQCRAFIDSYYCNPDGEIAPCRKVKGHCLNNGNMDIFSKFESFFETISILRERNCDECEYGDVCRPCPLDKIELKPTVCEIVQKRLKKLNFEDRMLRCTSTTVLIQNDNRYFTYIPAVECKTEYSKEGYKIIKACKKGIRLGELIKVVEMPKEIVMEFVLQEYQKGKLEME